jgi:SpoVK/Ycf46/Vps4 family AAA+-type ATPase
LPDFEAREAILEIHIGRRGIPLDCAYGDLAALTEGYSGRELGALCGRVIDRITAEQNPDLASLADRGAQAVKDYSLKFRPILQTDFAEAVRAIKPETSPKELERYHAWEQRLN